jgi:hypothetical protein
LWKEGEVGMTREGAVKGLLGVADWHYGKYEQTHEEDYLNDGDFLTAVANMLKEQEPRVMDFDDVVGGDECWLEAINGACGYADCYACTGTGEVQVFRCKYDNPQYIMAKDYLKTWRCWTSRPTDEQREKVKWE